MFLYPSKKGPCLDRRICNSPADHLSCWTNVCSSVVGASPKKPFLSGLKYTDLQPLHLIENPVIPSSSR